MQRIRFSDTQAGTSYYEVSINPSSMSYLDSKPHSIVSTIDGPGVVQTPKYDNRTGQLVWQGWPIDHATFSAMLSTLKGYIGSDKYMNLGDIAVPNSSLSGGYKKVHIIDVSTAIRPGGKEKYDQVVLTFQLLEALS